MIGCTGGLLDKCNVRNGYHDILDLKILSEHPKNENQNLILFLEPALTNTSLLCILSTVPLLERENLLLQALSVT